MRICSSVDVDRAGGKINFSSLLRFWNHVFIDASVLDDEKEVSLRIGQEIDVPRWVTVDQTSNLRGLGSAAVSISDVSQRIGQGPDSRSQQHNILDQKLARRRGERRESIPCLPYSWRRNDKTQRS